MKNCNNKKHHKFAGLPYIYRGLIRCADCGCVITPEKKKGKYVYYHCTQYDGNHKAKWLREEELTRQFAQLYKALKIPKGVLDTITASLRQSHKDKAQFHRTLLGSYQKEYSKYETRIESMYEDKLDGSITESFYAKKQKEYRTKQKEINGKMAKLQFADEEYYLTSEYLLKLASKASKLFESSELKEKRLLLKLTLQNLELEGKKVRYTYQKPFDTIANYASRQAWLRG